MPQQCGKGVANRPCAGVGEGQWVAAARCPLRGHRGSYLRCAPTERRLRRISALPGCDPLPERQGAGEKGEMSQRGRANGFGCVGACIEVGLPCAARRRWRAWAAIVLTVSRSWPLELPAK